MKTVVCVGAVALAVVAGRAWAQEGGFGKSGSTKEKPAAAKKDTAAKRDPVAEAFALPRGVVLRKDQQENFTAMKQEMEPKLRDACTQVESATGADKDKAAKSVMALRKEIKTKFAEILRQPDVAAIKAAQDAARAARDAGNHGRPPGRGPGRKRF